MEYSRGRQLGAAKVDKYLTPMTLGQIAAYIEGKLLGTLIFQ